MKRTALLCLLLFGCRHFGGKEFPARYRREGDTPQGAQPCAAFAKVVVRDPRPDPQLVGDRSQQDRAGAYPITMVGDVGAWVRDGIEAQARAASYKLDAAAGPTLNVTVNTIDMHENVMSNADLRSRVVLDVAVVLADGKTCFTTSVEGQGKNWGSSGNPDNYSQTLNRALDATTVTMFNLPAVREAACGRCP